jgi:hypothetical protein
MSDVSTKPAALPAPIPSVLIRTPSTVSGLRLAPPTFSVTIDTSVASAPVLRVTTDVLVKEALPAGHQWDAKTQSFVYPLTGAVASIDFSSLLRTVLMHADDYLGPSTTSPAVAVVAQPPVRKEVLATAAMHPQKGLALRSDNFLRSRLWGSFLCLQC